MFVSIIVSTLIDFQFKAAVKEAYPTRDVLTGFFGSFYAWLNVITLFSLVFLRGKLMSIMGLTPSFLLLPLLALSLGSLGLLVWPGLIAASGVRLADGALRTGVNRSAMEILYLAVPADVKKKVKTLYTATAVDHVHVIRLDAQDFHDLLSLDIEMVEAVFRGLCRQIRENR